MRKSERDKLNNKRRTLENWFKEWDKDDFPGRIKTNTYLEKAALLKEIKAKLAEKKRPGVRKFKKISRERIDQLMAEGCVLVERDSGKSKKYTLQGNSVASVTGQSLVPKLKQVGQDKVNTSVLRFYQYEMQEKGIPGRNRC